jgi:hypothetical protein
MSTRLMITFALTLVVGCSAFRGPKDGSGAQADSVVVQAKNENYYAARIHAVWNGGQRRALGTVAGNGGQARMVLAWEPRALAFEVLLVTEGSTYVSLPVDPSPGESIELRVPSNINESGFFRRVRR